MKLFRRFREDDWLGVRFALNVFIGTTALWVLLKVVADTNPLWAIASMIAASEPGGEERDAHVPRRHHQRGGGVRGRLAVLVLGERAEWKLPIAMSLAVIVSSYLVRIQTDVAAGADHRRHCHCGRAEPCTRS